MFSKNVRTPSLQCGGKGGGGSGVILWACPLAIFACIRPPPPPPLPPPCFFPFKLTLAIDDVIFSMLLLLQKFQIFLEKNKEPNHSSPVATNAFYGCNLCWCCRFLCTVIVDVYKSTLCCSYFYFRCFKQLLLVIHW